MSLCKIELVRDSESVTWGFRLQGGVDQGTDLSIQRVFSDTPAEGSLHRGDVIKSVNGNSIHHATLAQAHDIIKSAGNRLALVVERAAGHNATFEASHQDYHQDHHQDHHQDIYKPEKSVSTFSFNPQPTSQQFLPQNQHHHQPQQNQSPHPSHEPSHYPHQPHPTHEHPHHPHPTHEYPHQHHPTHEHHHHPQQPPLHHNHPTQFHHHQEMPHFAPSNDFQNSNHRFFPQQNSFQHQPQHQHQTQPQHQLQHQPQYQPHHQHQQPEIFQQPQLYEDAEVDRGHLRPVGDVKKMFNKQDFSSDTGRHLVTDHRVASTPLHRDTSTVKYQPPLPTIPPAAATDNYSPSLKHPPVYQQRSSYNPLDFKGVNNLIKPPPKHTNHPPGLIQRGADIHHNYQPPPLSKQQQEQRLQISSNHTNKTDTVSDFYLHGLQAPQVPEVHHQPQQHSHIASYSGRVLPPRSDPPISAPITPAKKKEFKADSSAVFQVLQEEEKRGNVVGGNYPEVKKFEAPSKNKGRLADLLEKDQIGSGFHHEPQQHQNHFQQQHHQQQHHYQQQQQPYQQQHHHQSQSTHEQQHYRNFTTVNLVSPTQQHQAFQQHHPQQQHHQQHHFNIGRTGIPETEF